MFQNLKFNFCLIFFAIILDTLLPFYLYSNNFKIYFILCTNFILPIFISIILFICLTKISFNDKKYLYMNFAYITLSTLIINKFSNWGYRDYNSILFTIFIVQLIVYFYKSNIKS